jgi:hypothetical protein
MRTIARLTFRQHQFEFVALGALFLVISAGMVAIMAIWSALPIAECMAATEMTRRCQQANEVIQVLGAIGAPLVMAAVGGPAFAGIVLGAGVVSTEIERGTVVMPWIMGRSRRRWLLMRMGVIAAFVGVTGLALAVLTDGVTLLYDPTPPAQSLYAYELRGWMVPARGLVGLAAGVLGGALMPRAVPAVLTGALIAVLCFLGVFNIGDGLNRAQAVEFDGLSGLYLSDVLRDHTGAIVTYEEAYARIPVENDEDWQAFQAEFTSRPVGVPGSESRIVTGREVLMLGGLAILLTVAAVWVVERRRPY